MKDCLGHFEFFSVPGGQSPDLVLETALERSQQPNLEDELGQMSSIGLKAKRERAQHLG